MIDNSPNQGDYWIQTQAPSNDQIQTIISQNKNVDFSSIVFDETTQTSTDSSTTKYAIGQKMKARYVSADGAQTQTRF